MRIALYIQDGLEQIVLTPEGKTETDILAKLHDGGRTLSIKCGSFFQCNGGWIRHSEATDTSTMLVLRSTSEEPSNA